MELHGYRASVKAGKVVFKNIAKAASVSRQVLSNATLHTCIRGLMTAFPGDYTELSEPEFSQYADFVEKTQSTIRYSEHERKSRDVYTGAYHSVWEKDPHPKKRVGDVLWVLFDTNRPIGLCRTSPTSNGGMEAHSVCSFDRSRKGVGTALIQMVARRVLSKAGCSLFEVYCLTANVPALKCYSRLADIQKKGECFARFSRKGVTETQYVLGKAPSVATFLQARLHI